MRREALGALVVLALVLAACGGGGSGSAEVDPDAPVLQISSEGGFVPVEFSLGNGPRYTVLGDGRVIFRGVQTAQFPGPLVLPYMVAQLSSSQLNAVLSMVDDIGLGDIDEEVDDSATNFVADASTEKITYWDTTGKHVYSVYALGIEESPSDRNASFLELIATLDRFTSEAPAEPLDVERVRVIGGPGFIGEEFQDIRAWPLDDEWGAWTELEIGWTCRVFGPEVIALFSDATQTTTWEIPDVFSYASPAKLIVRPLLPGEGDCP